MVNQASQSIHKPWGWILLFGVVVVSMTKCTSASEATSEDAIAYVTASSLNCRAEGDASADVVRQLPHGQRIQIAEVRDGWSRIDDTPPCWVLSDYLSVEQPAPPPVPAERPASSREIEALYSPKPKKRSTPATNRSCGRVPYCKEMNSCAEAQFYLRECGATRLDRDGDGVPCENVC